MQKKDLIAIFFIAVLILLSYFIFHSFDQEVMQLLAELESRPVLFSTLNIGLLSLDAILPIPSSILMFLNGKVLGIFGGTVLSVIGASLGNYIAYRIGYSSNKVLYKEKQFKQSKNLLSDFGIWAIMITRAIPVVAEATMMYAGLQQRKLRPILGFAILGYIPVCLVYATLGSLMFETKGFIIALASSIIFSLMIILAFNFIRKKKWGGINLKGN